MVTNAGNSTVVSQLGLGVDEQVASVSSLDLDPAGTSGTGAVIEITNSLGVTGSVDLAGAQSIQDILAGINDAGLGVEATLSASGTGLQLVDTEGGLGDLVVADGAGGVLATQLGLAGTFAGREVDGGPLGFQFINEGTRLDSLGVASGQFTITDSDGLTSTVDLTQGNEVTIADVISEINSRGLAINARVNDTGDGLFIEDLGGGTTGISITDDGSTTAADLGLAGDFAAGASVDGSFRQTVTVTATDTLQSLVARINGAGVGVNASVINDGSPGAPFRLSLSSESSGAGGAFTLDDGGLDLGIANLSEASDAVVFFGGDDPADALVVTSGSNTLDTLISGATISLLGTSDGPIQLTVGEDTEALVSAASDFVDSFNGVVSTINGFDSFNADTQEAGLLLSDSTVAQVRTAIFNAVIGANTALTGQFNSLAQVGIQVGSGAVLQFDQNEFQAAILSDPDALRDLFAFQQFEVDPETGEETQELVAQGVGVEIRDLLASLTDPADGIVQNQVDLLGEQIQANNDSIDDINESIEVERDRLEAEFNALEFALADLQDQQSALNLLAAN